MTNNQNIGTPLAYVTREIQEYTHRVKTISKLRGSQILFPAKPEIPGYLRDEDGDFKMPSDITDMPSHELGRIMGAVSGMLQWYGAVLATAKIDKLTAERVKNFTEAKIRMEIMRDEQMVKAYKAREDKDAYVNTSELVLEAQDWFDAQEATVLMTEQIYKDMERSFALVSREISRRGSEWNRGEREGKLQ